MRPQQLRDSSGRLRIAGADAKTRQRRFLRPFRPFPQLGLVLCWRHSLSKNPMTARTRAQIRARTAKLRALAERLATLRMNAGPRERRAAERLAEQIQLHAAAIRSILRKLDAR